MASAKKVGDLMVTSFPIAEIGWTVQKVKDLIAKRAKSFQTIDYIYVTDKQGVLKGVLSLKELLDADNERAHVERIMGTRVISAHPGMRPENAVYLALKHEIKAMPIADGEGRLLGVVPYNTLMRVFNEEAHEDMVKFGGIFHKVGKEYSAIDAPIPSMVRHRLPWLVVGVLGGAVTASVITGFENVLSKLLALAAFTPVLAYLSDAVGTQSETLTVRSIALKPEMRVGPYLAKELLIAAILAAICGLLLACIALIGWQEPLLGVIVGISMFFGIIAAVLISTLLPFIFRRLSFDPAFASGPLATLVSDIATISIYFIVASGLMGNYGLL